MLLAAAAALTALLAAGDRPPDAQSGRPDGAPAPVSVERVREGLDRPQVLKMPNPEEMAYFRATIEEKLPIDDVLAAMRRDLARWSGTPIVAPTGHPAPLVASVDVLPLARAFLRWRAERRVRQTVQEALDEFCSTHDCSILEGAPPIEGVLMPPSRPPSSSMPLQ
jgi:hypothetical protein